MRKITWEKCETKITIKIKIKANKTKAEDKANDKVKAKAKAKDHGKEKKTIKKPVVIDRFFYNEAYSFIHAVLTGLVDTVNSLSKS